MMSKVMGKLFFCLTEAAGPQFKGDHSLNCEQFRFANCGESNAASNEDPNLFHASLAKGRVEAPAKSHTREMLKTVHIYCIFGGDKKEVCVHQAPSILPAHVCFVSSSMHQEKRG